MKLNTQTYWIKTHDYKQRWWKKHEPSDFIIKWSEWGSTTYYETFADALRGFDERITITDELKFTCEIDEDLGRLTITDKPLPTPIASYRIGILTVPNNEDHLHYTVEKLEVRKGWVVLYKDRDRKVMEEEMKVQAAAHKYDGDDHGIIIDAFEDYELVNIYNDGEAGYHDYVNTDSNLRLCGVHVVNYHV